jgi:flagella basal body P-ring formation protein FlgA
MSQIVAQLREFFLKKHKVDIKPTELKNHMTLFLDSTIINPSFSSQTKEKLITEVKEFGTTFEVSNKLVQSILKSEIVNSILDWIEQKKNAEENKLQREINKKLSKIKVEKLIDAKGKDRWKCSLGLFEGDSAAGAFRKYRTSETMGAFSLRGKFINVSEITNQKLVQNTEAVNLMAAIGLKLGQPIELKHLRYGKIFFYTDADCLQENTLIATKSGYKKISEIEYDDEVLTHTGSYKKVKKIIKKDISKYMKIKISGNDIICSEDHKLLVFRDGEVLEVEAKNIKYSDFFLLKNK